MMGPLAAIAIGAAVLGTSLATPPEPTPLPPHPLTDVQREMLESGMFESDSFREPAFEALVENVRSWESDFCMPNRQTIYGWAPEQFAEIFDHYPGDICSIEPGTVRMAEPLGDAFPGVTRLTIELRSTRQGNRIRTVLVFLVDEEPPEIGSSTYFIGRIYKIMHLQTQQSDLPTPFPAIVARTYDGTYIDPSDEDALLFDRIIDAFPAIITALTGMLAVIFFIVVVMGRRMKGNPAPRRSPLASAADRPDDPSDA